MNRIDWALVIILGVLLILGSMVLVGLLNPNPTDSVGWLSQGPPVQPLANFPAIRSTASGTTTLVTGTVSTYAFNLPAGHTNGDLLVFLMAGITSTTQPTFTFEGQWHTLYNSWTSASRIAIAAWSIDDAASGATGEFTTTVANTYRYIVYDMQVGTWNTASPPQVGTAAVGTSVNPDPPAITPTWGSDDDLFIATGIWVSTATRSACPASYASPVDVTGTSPGISACSRTLTGTTDNPGTFTISASTAWTAQTVAVRGAAASLPTATFTYTISGLTAAFTSTVVGGQGAITYAWNFGDGSSSTLANPSRTYAAGTSRFTVSLTVTDTATPPRSYVAWGTVVLNYPTLLTSVAESAGANCANAGQKITYGLDNGDGGGTALDGTLQAGEVDATFYVCNGVNGFNSLILTVSEPVGVNCLTGGIKINTGLDNGDGGGTARDGILQSGEFDAGPFYVCNGSPGIAGTTGPQGPPGPQGSPGFNSLVKLTSESAGVNCANAGIKVQSGLDNGDGGGTANDGILQSGEVDATAYVCNGATGPTGSAGHSALVLTSPESPGSNCANGGVRITSGTDTNDDGILQAGEITSTSYACNGAQGSQGSPGSTGPTGQTGPSGSTGPTGPTGGIVPIMFLLFMLSGAAIIGWTSRRRR